MRRRIAFSAQVVLPFILMACAHQGEVVNDHLIRKTLTHGPPVNVAVLPYEGDLESEPFHDFAVEALTRHPSVRDVRTHWRWEGEEPGFRPHVVVDVTPNVDYRGSWWNYLIAFPGCIFFTPAWHGFVYYGDVTTDFAVYTPTQRKTIASDSVRTEYSMRHCDAGRGVFASASWWTPYAVGSALTGLYMITYDDDATEFFESEIRKPYGDYIAESIMRPVVESVRVAYAKKRRKEDGNDRIAIPNDPPP